MPFDAPATQQGLAASAHARLADRFAEVGHHPSAEQWTAIDDLLSHLQSAAEGRLDDALYLSPLPAGTGKSQSLAAFAAALMDDPAQAGTGMLITVSRITEARDMAEKALAGYRHKLCVITSDAEANAGGAHVTADTAQVCIATQAALKLTLKAMSGRPFGDAARFHYRGARRAIVTWDEAFAFRRPVTLDPDASLPLVKAIRRQSPQAADDFGRWALDVSKGSTGLHAVPDFAEMGIDFHRLEDDIGDRDELVAQVKALELMSGGQAFATRGDFGPTFVTHYPEIPPSLMPLIVTDASAKVNASYAQMARTVPVRWLQEAHKTYRNMTIRIVPTAASRSVYRDPKTTRGRALIDMAVHYVRSVAPEEVLVVSYKGHMAMRGVSEGTIAAAIDARLTDAEKWIDKETKVRRVHHLTFGRHTATNDFTKVRRVILMGLNFLPRPTGHAAAGAALDLDLLKDHPTPDQIEAQQRGMLKDATLQAVLRGNARMGVDGDCGVMEVVIPQAKLNGLTEAEYLQMFPGVHMMEDTILMPAKPLKGRLRDLSEIVARRLAGGETELTYQSLYTEMAMQRSNFSALVKKPGWKAYAANAGLRSRRIVGGEMAMRLGG